MEGSSTKGEDGARGTRRQTDGRASGHAISSRIVAQPCSGRVAIIGRWPPPPRRRQSGVPGAPLGGLAVATFLRRHWHKKPLLVRAAVAGLHGTVSARATSSRSRGATTSNRDSSCATERAGRSRTVRSAAPTSTRCPRATGRCSCRASTSCDPAGDALLRRFAFLPFARLDDLMVSYAAPGGGVGPHVDSYDVFLLQGFGRRRWRFGAQDDRRAEAAVCRSRSCGASRPTHDDDARAGRHAVPAAAYRARRRRDRRVHDLFDRLSRAGARRSSARRFSTSCATSSTCRDAMPTRTWRPSASPAAIGAAMRRRYLQHARGHHLGPRERRPASSAAICPSRSRTSSSSRRTSPLRASRVSSSASAKRGMRLDPRTQLLYDDRAPLHQRHRAAVARERRRDAPAPRQRPCARAARRHGRCRRKPPTILYNWYRDGYVHTGTA